MRTVVALGIVLLAALMAVPCLGQPGLNSPEARRMQKHVERREALVKGWANEAEQQVILSLAVGILGLAVGVLQKPTKNWARILTVVVGFCVSAITLCTNKLYPADYQTLQRAVEEANPVIEELDDFPEKYDTASDQDKLQISVDFARDCGKVDEISHRILGVELKNDHQSQKGANQAMDLFSVGEVFAQSSPPVPSGPAWVQSHAKSEGSITYFIGVGRDSSLATAKSLALKSASYSGAFWIQQNQSGNEKNIPPQQLVDIVQQESQIVNTWFDRESATQVYVYYIRIGLPNEFAALDTSELSANPAISTLHGLPRVPRVLKLPNDSAIWDAGYGVTILVKHMGFAPISANLYVLAPDASQSKDTVHYLHDRKQTEQYVASFKTVMQSCDGRHATIGENEVWCFHVDDSYINPKKGKTQYLGRVIASGRNADLYAVRLDYQEPSLSVELKDTK